MSSPMANLSLSLVIISPSIHSYSLSSLNLLLRPIGKPSTTSQTQLLKEQCCTNHLSLLPRILCQTTLPTNPISILTSTPLRIQNPLTSTILLPTNHRPTTIRPIMTQHLSTLRRSLLQIWLGPLALVSPFNATKPLILLALLAHRRPPRPCGTPILHTDKSDWAG
jgi:hypothetical protein